MKATISVTNYSGHLHSRYDFPKLRHVPGVGERMRLENRIGDKIEKVHAEVVAIEHDLPNEIISISAKLL